MSGVRRKDLPSEQQDALVLLTGTHVDLLVDELRATGVVIRRLEDAIRELKESNGRLGTKLDSVVKAFEHAANGKKSGNGHK